MLTTATQPPRDTPSTPPDDFPRVTGTISPSSARLPASSSASGPAKPRVPDSNSSNNRTTSITLLMPGPDPSARRSGRMEHSGSVTGTISLSSTTRPRIRGPRDWTPNAARGTPMSPRTGINSTDESTGSTPRALPMIPTKSISPAATCSGVWRPSGRLSKRTAP